MSSSRRVLLVTGPAAGGLKRHVGTLAEHLPRRGLEVAAVAPKGVFPASAVTFPLELGDRPRPAADLRAAAQLRRAVREWQPEVIHAHGVKAALLTLLSVPAGLPVVVTYHNRWLGGPLTSALRLLAPRARASIAVSQAVQESLEQYGVRARPLQVVRNGVDPEVFRIDERRRNSGEPFTVLFLGRLTEEKGIPLLLEAVQSLDPTAVRILVAGDGPLRPAVEAEARVEYVGPQADVLPVYARADAVIMPSLSEGLPMTALEAMSCGLPLLAADVGGIPEVVAPDETGVLLSTRDPEVWARTVLRLAGDPEAATRMGAAGRERVLREFTLARMLDEVGALYRQLLRAPGKAVAS